jgi:hypothetical protein
MLALALDASAAAPVDPAKTTTNQGPALTKPKVTFTKTPLVRDPALRYASFSERQVTQLGPDVTIGAINLPDRARLRVVECFVHDNENGGPAGNELKLVASAFGGQGGGATLVKGTVKLEGYHTHGRAHVVGLDHIVDNFATEYYVSFDRGTGSIELDGCTFGFVPPPPL